jgi:Cu/Zn superoxide dismutase
MKNLMKKLFMLTSILGVTVLMAACSSDSSTSKSSDGTEYYQTQERADVKRVTAKMYTHSSGSSEARMGDIKFNETESGLRMAVDLKDLRPGVEYTINLYKMDCGDLSKEEMKKVKKDKAEMKKMCSKEKMSANLPMLKAGTSGKLEETFMIRGLTAAQLQHAKVVLSRSGSEKAAWGKLEKTMF